MSQTSRAHSHNYIEMLGQAERMQTLSSTATDVLCLSTSRHFAFVHFTLKSKYLNGSRTFFWARTFASIPPD